MCLTCGCGDDDVRLERVDGPEHTHSHDHPHDHDHNPQVHLEPSAHETEILRLGERVLTKNDELAEHVRGWLVARGLTAVNLMSSPGAGKTSLLERTIAELAGRLAVAVVEGDQETRVDAERITRAGARAVQVNTGAGCHLDASMVQQALVALEPEDGSLVFVENVGNLVCPALFDIGEHARAVVISVTEGDDKPIKYPHMFAAADVVVVNKTDLLPYVDFDVDRLVEQARSLNPDVTVLPLSVRTGENLDTWMDWLDLTRQGVRTRTPDPAIGAPVDNQTLRETSERIDELLDELGQSAVPAVMERVEELMRSVLTLYGAGLDRVMELADHSADEGLVRRLADDDVVGNLLILHDLHPDDVLTRVQAALDQVRPYLGSHAGGVELLGVDAESVAHLKLEGSCDGCASSALTVQSAIEDAIMVAAPDVVAVVAEGMVDPGPALLQIQPFRARDERETPADTAGWQHLELDVSPRTLAQVNLGDARLAVANLDGTLVAYLDRCPSCGAALSGGSLAADVLTCSSCGQGYDARRAGRTIDDTGGSPMVPVPLLPEHGGWKAALPQGAVA